MESTSTPADEPETGSPPVRIVQQHIGGQPPAALLHDLAVERVPVGRLHTYHRNSRRGSVPAIRESLRVNGQYKPVVVNRGTFTGRPDEVLAGNHTLIGARDEGWPEVWATFVDVDDDAAARIVAADNRVAELGEMDTRLLAEMLGDLPDLGGTGFDLGDLDDLVAALEEGAGDDATGPRDRLGASGVNQTRSLTEQKQLYDDADTRTIVLAYPLDEFEAVIDGLGELAERYDVDSNAAVVAHLVRLAVAGEAVTP